MPDFLPFRGVRYAAEAAEPPDDRAGSLDVGAVAAPPYDVIDADERHALAARHPHNAVRLILPDAVADPYQDAAHRFETWRHDGVLVVDERPALYPYRMSFTDEAGRRRVTHGVIGALALPDAHPSEGTPADGASVLPHERTLPKARSDRLSLLRATRANLDPIWGLTLGAGLAELVERHARGALARCTDPDGVEHTLARVDDADGLAAIAGVVRDAPLVLADGHHRFQTACTYREERERTRGRDPGADAIMCFVAELADEELDVRPIHRILSGLGTADLRGALAAAFTVVATGPNTPDRVGALRARMRDGGGLGLVDRDGLALLVPRDEVLAPALAALPAPLDRLDASRFEHGLLPALPTGTTVAYRNDAAVVASLVEKGGADAAVLLRPVSVRDIREAAFAGLRMPQKTTYFYPKPRTGMVFRSLDEADALT